MFGFAKKKVELPYEQVGYLYAERVPLLVDGLTSMAEEWTGQVADRTAMGRELAILALVVFDTFLTVQIDDEDARRRVVGGFITRIQERYSDFTSDADLRSYKEYLIASRNDLAKKDDSERFPTLVPLVAKRIAGIGRADAMYPTASQVIYELMNTVMNGSLDAVVESKKRFRLV